MLCLWCKKDYTACILSIYLMRGIDMYKVFGYTDMCEDFEEYFDSFCEAVKWFKKMNTWCITFIRRTDDDASCLFVR